MGIYAQRCVHNTAQNALSEGLKISTAQPLILDYKTSTKEQWGLYRDRGFFYEDHRELISKLRRRR